MDMQKAGAGLPHSKKKGLNHFAVQALLEIIPAATYVPTQLPVQYHRPGEA
jgi:hypothetical protein